MEGSSQQKIQERVKKILGEVQGLPTLPTMLGQINKLMLNPRTSAKEVGQLISSDPAIASRVLRVVNSSFYGFPNRITTITHGIVILGFNTVKSIVLSSCIFDVFKPDPRKPGFDRTQFWKHSIGCGAAAKVLGRSIGYPSLEELFIAGLVHDVGKIILDQFMHEPFQDALVMAKEKNCLLVEAEEEVLGITHADIGASLFEMWNLSGGLVECTRFHHNPALANENMKHTSIIHLADILVRTLRTGSGGDNRIPMVSESAWNELGLESNRLPQLLEDVTEEAEKATVFLDFI